jgi:hypothetical protein
MNITIIVMIQHLLIEFIKTKRKIISYSFVYYIWVKLIFLYKIEFNVNLKNHYFLKKINKI